LQAGGETGALNGALNGALTGALSSQILQLIEEHPGIQRKTIIDRLGVPGRTTDRHLAKLISGAKIERRGSKKTGGYWLCEKL
jgi:ATP-dependent DNA helicase RecG